jgi:hypothetical protein
MDARSTAITNTPAAVKQLKPNPRVSVGRQKPPAREEAFRKRP